MISRIKIKRAIKGGTGIAAAAASRLVRPATGSTGCILAYHRVADLGFIDPSIDDWNVTPSRFEQQVLELKTFADIVPLEDLRERCAAANSDRPQVVLTFDDGYANFHSQVLPILRRHKVPATVFVVTGLIGSKEPPPFDAWSMKHGHTSPPEAWRPMNWEELRECAASGLVTIGGHSHSHGKATELNEAELRWEASRSHTVLAAELGEVRCYAYPYGSSRLGYVPDAYVAAVAEAGYDLAVTYDLGRVGADTDPLRMPRLEAHATDGPAALRAKVAGSLAPYMLTDRLRRAKRSA